MRFIFHEGHIFALFRFPKQCCREFLLGVGPEMGQRGYLDEQSFERPLIVPQCRSVLVLGGVVTFELPMLTFELPMLTFELPSSVLLISPTGNLEPAGPQL